MSFMRTMMSMQFLIVLLLLAACGGDPSDDSGVDQVAGNDEEGTVADEGEDELDEYVLGALLQLSGEVAYFGEWTRNGIELAVEDINNAGGVNGKPLRVRYRDSENESATAISQFRQAADIDGVPAVMASGSVAVLPVCPVADEMEVVLLNASANSPLIRDCGDFTVSLISDSTTEMQAIADYLFNEMGIRRMATMNMNNDVGVGIRDAFIQAWEELDGDIVASESAEIGTQNFRSQISSLSSAEPEGVVLAAEAPDAAVILRQAEQLELDVQWAAQANAINDEVIEIAGDGAEGIIISQIGFNPETGSPQMQEFEERYHASFEHNPALVYSATFYDATMLLAEAIENSGYSGEAIAAYINGLDTFEGASGQATFVEPGVVEREVILRTVRDGEFVSLS